MLRSYRRQDIPLIELAAKTIDDILLQQSSHNVLKHADFQTVDAEDSVFQLCGILHRLSADFVPVIDPDEGNLVSILGYLDLVHLLHEASRQYPQFFSATIQQLGIGTFTDVVTAPHTALLFDVIELIEDRNLSGIPVTNELGQVVGLYHKSDVSFITKAVDPDSAILSLHTLQVGEALRMQQMRIDETGSILSEQTLCTCSFTDALSTVLDTMMRAQVTRVICVDGSGRCQGVVSIRDIVLYYFDYNASGR